MSFVDGAAVDNINRTVNIDNFTSGISCVRGHPDLLRGDAEVLGKCLGVTAEKVRMTSDDGVMT